MPTTRRRRSGLPTAGTQACCRRRQRERKDSAMTRIPILEPGALAARHGQAELLRKHGSDGRTFLQGPHTSTPDGGFTFGMFVNGTWTLFVAHVRPLDPTESRRRYR